MVTICHKPSTLAQRTLSVAEPSLPIHLAHGDAVGACPSDFCSFLDTFDITFTTSQFIDYSEAFFNFELRHDETVTATYINDDTEVHKIHAEITPASSGDVYKILPMLFASVGATGSDDFLPVLDPSAETDFRLTIFELSSTTHVLDGTVTIRLDCS